jgi:hypothetical protein
MPENASIIVCTVENPSAFIITHVILDFLYLTTNAALSVRPSQHIIHADMLIRLFHIP